MVDCLSPRWISTNSCSEPYLKRRFEGGAFLRSSLSNSSTDFSRHVAFANRFLGRFRRGPADAIGAGGAPARTQPAPGNTEAAEPSVCAARDDRPGAVPPTPSRAMPAPAEQDGTAAFATSVAEAAVALDTPRPNPSLEAVDAANGKACAVGEPTTHAAAHVPSEPGCDEAAGDTRLDTAGASPPAIGCTEVLSSAGTTPRPPVSVDPAGNTSCGGASPSPAALEAEDA
mmetsp:Transcript_53158/g.154783  ORF Transcript_53158/g.154783 Transcript_53158/m.154783 type:complete len:229 (+) Transcript_53158:779-1465(+)